MGLANPATMSEHPFASSMKLTSPLVATIATQDKENNVDIMEIKASIKRSNSERQKEHANIVYDHLHGCLFYH